MQNVAGFLHSVVFIFSTGYQSSLSDNTTFMEHFRVALADFNISLRNRMSFYTLNILFAPALDINALGRRIVSMKLTEYIWNGDRGTQDQSS